MTDTARNPAPNVGPQGFGERPLSVRQTGHYREEYVNAFVDKWDELIDWDARAGSEGAFFIDQLKQRGAKKILDVATGTGFHSVRLIEAGFDVVSSDGSAQMLFKAFENGKRRGHVLRTVQADLTHQRLDGVYDVAWSSMALHHVHDLDALLTSVAEHLADGGRLAIADLESDPGGAFHADRAGFDGHHGFDRDDLAEQITRAGFVDVGFVDAATVVKGDREFGVFLCTATKAPGTSGS